MKKRLIALSMLCATHAFAEDAVERIDAANARCEAAREQKLAPIRAQKIAQCQRGTQQPTAGCEVYYSTYGNNSNHANGSVVHGRFYDLPACVAARRSSNRLLRKQDFQPIDRRRRRRTTWSALTVAMQAPRRRWKSLRKC